MKKLFVFGDAHSFLTPLKEALDKAGFDPNNEDHWLVSCGDLFDRGPESKEMLHYIMSIERKILVKGNHDLLLEDCCKRKYPYMNDYSNGTARTIDDIGGASEGRAFTECCYMTWAKLEAYRGLLVNYFETENHIFVHSWIPVNQKGFGKYTFREDWRDATNSEWEDAMWGKPFEKAQNGLNETSKTIVFGHWHCSTGHSINSHGKLTEFGHDACWDIYHNKEQKIIGIDKCTAHTGEVNVLVLEDEFI